MENAENADFNGNSGDFAEGNQSCSETSVSEQLPLENAVSQGFSLRNRRNCSSPAKLAQPTGVLEQVYYTRELVKLSAARANVFGILLLAGALALFGLPFYLIWHDKHEFVSATDTGNPQAVLNAALSLLIYAVLSLLIFLAGIVLHELIHGIFFAAFAKNGIKSVKFGIMPAKQMFTLYCNCREKLKVNHYRIAAIMPTIILGVLPAVTALFTGNGFLLFFGSIFVSGGGGDILMILKLRKDKSNVWVLDHPSEIGFYRRVPAKNEQGCSTTELIEQLQYDTEKSRSAMT